MQRLETLHTIIIMKDTKNQTPALTGQTTGLDIGTVETFSRLLRQAPVHTKVYQGITHVPIEQIENTLDEVYAGQWQTSNVKVFQLLNSICCTLTLSVLHPISGIWLTREGTGAVPVQLMKDAKVITPETIQTFAIQKGAGAAKSFAIKNAAESLGEIFGRNLGRKDVATSEFYGISDRFEDFSELENARKEALNLFQISKWAGNPVLLNKINKSDINALNVIILNLQTEHAKPSETPESNV